MCAIIGLPHNRTSGFGREDFIRVPSPAASTTAKRTLADSPIAPLFPERTYAAPLGADQTPPQAQSLGMDGLQLERDNLLARRGKADHPVTRDRYVTDFSPGVALACNRGGLQAEFAGMAR